MVLEGLRATTWLAWLTGTIYIELPFGAPSFKSWTHPIVIYHSSIFIINTMLWLDYTMHYNETFGGDLPIRQIITKIFTYLTLLCTIYIRTCFVIFAKRIACQLNCIESRIRNKIQSNKIIHRFDRLIIRSTLILQMISAGIFAAAVATQRSRPPSSDSWFMLLSRTEYTIILCIFGTLPIAAAHHLTLAFSIVVTKYLIYFFEEFCTEFESNLIIRHGISASNMEKNKSCANGYGIVRKIPKLTFQPPTPTPTSIIPVSNKPTPYSISSLPSYISPHVKSMNSIAPVHNNSRVVEVENITIIDDDSKSGVDAAESINNNNQETLLQQMDFIFKVFYNYDQSMGPLLLGLVLSTITFLVQAVNAIMIFELTNLFFAFNWLILIALLMQLIAVIFNMGHFAHKVMYERKLKLRRLIVEMPYSAEKVKLMETLDLFSAWNWKMSAWSFFVIDRSLVPGVISIMMSYIMILFQVQLNTSVARN